MRTQRGVASGRLEPRRGGTAPVERSIERRNEVGNCSAFHAAIMVITASRVVS